MTSTKQAPSNAAMEPGRDDREDRWIYVSSSTRNPARRNGARS